MNYRNRKLLDLAHRMDCTAKFYHKCEGHLGCEPAHSDSSIFGRGFGFKTHDFAFASMCHTAHMMLDTFSRDQKQTEWMLAYVATQKYLWENELIKVNK